MDRAGSRVSIFTKNEFEINVCSVFCRVVPDRSAWESIFSGKDNFAIMQAYSCIIAKTKGFLWPCKQGYYQSLNKIDLSEWKVIIESAICRLKTVEHVEKAGRDSAAHTVFTGSKALFWPQPGWRGALSAGPDQGVLLHDIA